MIDNDETDDILREIKGLRDDEKSGLITITAEKENFAKSLKNGLGEAMIEYLNNPPKPSLWTRLKRRIRNIFK
jgi:hypothetical protein